MKWKDINKELPNEELDDCKVKMKDGEIIDAEYIPEKELFQVMYGNYYHIKKSNGWKEFNICKNKFTGSVATHWAYVDKEEKERRAFERKTGIKLYTLEEIKERCKKEGELLKDFSKFMNGQTRSLYGYYKSDVDRFFEGNTTYFD